MSSLTTHQQKLCHKCGKDVTHDRRMKDGKGHYWCADCGAVDASINTSGLIAPCPKCHTPTHAKQLIRKDGIYVCEACATGVKRGKSGTKVGTKVGGAPVVILSDEDRAKRKKIVLGVSLLVLGAVAYVGMNYYLM